MKVLSLFSGIGAFEKALERMNVDYELVNFCEFDKYAVKSYCAIHGVDESKNLGDITKVDSSVLPKNIDLITYGFPCQDISLAGKQKGLFNEDGTQTQSGLFFEALRIIEDTKPKIAIAENVKNLTSKKFNAQFQIVLESLERAGYNNYWQVLNAKDYGIPQNRERVFIVSIRKDIDTGMFQFPLPVHLELVVKDILDDAVDEKFYLSAQAIKGYNRHKERNQEKGNGFGWNPTDGHGVATCINTTPSKSNANYIIDAKCVQVGQLYGTEREPNPQAGRGYDANGLSPTMDSCSGGNRMPKVAIPQATKRGYAECEVGGVADLSFPNSKTRRGRVQGGGNICPTITAESTGISRIEPEMRIRKLTPKECFRLMGFDDSDFEKAEAVNSNTQLYKQAGNSIVVNVLEHIFKNLFSTIPITQKENETMYRTDCPIADFNRHDSEQEEWLSSRPMCDNCKEHIQDDHYYEIDGFIYCPNCMENDFKRLI